MYLLENEYYVFIEIKWIHKWANKWSQQQSKSIFDVFFGWISAQQLMDLLKQNSSSVKIKRENSFFVHWGLALLTKIEKHQHFPQADDRADV